MLAVPLSLAVVGVNVAVRTRPLPEIAPSVPPLTPTSPVLPSHAKVEPGSSLKVNVIVAVSPIFNCDTSLVIETVGAVISIPTARPEDDGPTLPAASVAVAEIVWLPSLSPVLVIDQGPPLATALPSTVAPSVSYSVTVDPDSAVPLKVGVVTLVRLSVDDVPPSEPTDRSGVDGAFGARVSKCRLGVVPALPSLPAASV